MQNIQNSTEIPIQEFQDYEDSGSDVGNENKGKLLVFWPDML